MSAILVLASGRRMSWRDMILPFTVIFLATWAGGLWTRPIGPAFRGVYWLPFVLVGLLCALFLFTTKHRKPPPHNRPETIELLERIEEERELEKITYFSVTVLFWVLLFSLIGIIIIGYAWTR
jgi:hypothetical protein